MKLFCAQKDLDYALNIVNKAIGLNNTLPVLNNILLKAEGKKLFFSSTNLEIAISCSISADVRAEGAITIPAKLITNYVSLLTDEKVEVSVVEGVSLAVNSSSSHTKIKCISADEFPLIPKVEKGQELSISVDDFYKAAQEMIMKGDESTFTVYSTCERLGQFIKECAYKIEHNQSCDITELYAIFLPTGDWDDSGGSLNIANQIVEILGKELK